MPDDTCQSCASDEKIFDDIARAPLRKILARQEFTNAMQRKWGDDTAVKTQQFEDRVST